MRRTSNEKATQVMAGLPSRQPLIPGPTPKPSVLKCVEKSVHIDAIAAYDPSGFKTRPGLWVSPSFHSWVGSKAKPVENLSAIRLKYYDLTEDAYDEMIGTDPTMPANHVFESESEFVARLDQTIQKQANGEAGDLLNNGSANLFYVVGCVVCARRPSNFKEWSVDGWWRGLVGWRAGVRVFSSN